MITNFRFMIVLTLLSLLLSACGSAAPTAAVEPTSPPANSAPEQPTVEAPSQAPIKLVVWWWGEQEAPGAQKFMDETIAEYQKLHPNITIEAVLQSTDTLIPSFQAAAAAKEGPDIQYFWGGVWTLENAWSNAIVPVDDLIPAAERDNYINNFERTYNGKLWGVPWYLSGNPMVFNPKLFEKAGLDPKNPPKTWEELKNACAKLNAIGVTPISGGLKDGWFGGWLFSILARQTHDSEKEFMAAAVGQAKFTDPAFSEWWSRLDELKQANCWNSDIVSIDYQQGQDLFVQGKSAMIFGNDTFLKGWADTIGWDNMAVMMVPKYADKKLANTYVTTAQGWGITYFLMYMHTPERLSAWFKYTGVLPADKRMDPSLIDQPILKQIYDWDTTVAGPNLENFIPSMLDEQSNYAGAQLLFSGDKKPEELAQMAEDVITKWRDQSAEQKANFEAWAK
ncbi:MAG: extracellular solute-binding protein [Chloroflexi bacterium]|nr:extracellular solute-binding protein [Chloroflexota bacterium]